MVVATVSAEGAKAAFTSLRVQCLPYLGDAGSELDEVLVFLDKTLGESYISVKNSGPLWILLWARAIRTGRIRFDETSLFFSHSEERSLRSSTTCSSWAAGLPTTSNEEVWSSVRKRRETSMMSPT